MTPTETYEGIPLSDYSDEALAGILRALEYVPPASDSWLGMYPRFPSWREVEARLAIKMEQGRRSAKALRDAREMQASLIL